MSKISKIEIEFAAPVEVPEELEQALAKVVEGVCDKYNADNPDRVMWPFGVGSKPKWSKLDAAFLGKPADPNAPDTGEPTFDDSVFFVECAERER